MDVFVCVLVSLPLVATGKSVIVEFQVIVTFLHMIISLRLILVKKCI